MPEKISSIKHKSESRAHIPSKEEAGYEDASPKVLGGKPTLELPKNPVVHRGQDPELFWMNKYGTDDIDDLLKVDIRSLYRHEHIAPEKLIAGLHRVVEEKNPLDQMDLFSANELFGNALEKDELQKVSEYYSHHEGWTNRLIQGDSHLVMASLLEREGMAGQVQTIYIDPPYGIKYNSNWQMKLNDRNVKDGSDEHLTGEPEMIKAFRDTWELGIHSYLTYLRDRLLIARELLTESGSCFVQISDENVHLVRCLMDEVFGSENFVSLINVLKTAGKGSRYLDPISDYLILYAKNSEVLKYRQIFQLKGFGSEKASEYIRIERLVSSTLHAKGFYPTPEGEKKAYFHIGPKFGTVSKHAVNEAVKECRQRGDANWLIILGFSFESDITSSTQTTSMGTFEVTKARMHDDLMQDGLMKKDKKAGSFITIGEPDIKLHKTGIEATVEICGLDIYDPIKDQVKARNVADIAYWMVDDDYDGSNFVVKQLFFCGGSQDEFSQWKKGLSNLARTKTKRNTEKTLKIEIDDEAFDRLYGFISHPIQVKQGQKIAIRVISQFGEESMKVITVSD